MLKVDSVNSISQLWIISGSPLLSSVVHLASINKCALVLSRLSDSVAGRRGSYFQAQALYLSLRTS